MAELTGKQSRFCEEYIFDFNASRAARAAGYSEDTAGSIGHELLKKPEIQKEITTLQEDLSKTSGISRLKVLRELEKIAFSSIAQLHDSWITRKEFDNLKPEIKDSIAEIQTQTRIEKDFSNDPDGTPMQVDYVKIKLFDKLKAMDSINKMLGFDAPKKITVNTTEKQVMKIGGQEIEF